MKLSGFKISNCTYIDKGLFEIVENSSLILENMIFDFLESKHMLFKIISYL